MSTVTRTHHVYNPTGSTITVNVNAVTSHATTILTITDADAAGFAAAGAILAELTAGTASPALERGFVSAGSANSVNDAVAFLSAASGTIATTSLAIAGSGKMLVLPIAKDQMLRLDDGQGHSLFVTCSAQHALGASALTVASVTPAFNFPIGTPVYLV